MKKIIAYILVGILCLAAIGGLTYSLTRNKDKEPVNEVVQEENLSSEEALKKAEEYLKTIYKDVEKETPRDYERIGVVPIGKFKFQVTWSVDVSEEYVKIIVNENGMVTIDVNEECGEEIPYVLTATIKDEKGNIRKLTWEHIIPKKITGSYQEIVDMAYALKSGESLPNEATLQGTVTTINTPWDSGYKNITVTITVEGREDKPIQCYRLKSGAADASLIEKGDLITVTGILKNYNGTIEFDAGCVLDANEKGAGTILKVSGTMQEIVDKAYALKDGETLKGEATLTGTVTNINSAWSDQYKNISVTIVVEGREDKPIQCYRLKSGAADASQIAKGDLITVTGVLKNFKGTIEFDAGCVLDENKKGAGTIETVSGTMQEIVDKAYALEEGATLKGEATLTGTVTAVTTAWSDDFKNITVTIAVEGRESKPITCYRMKSGAADASKVEKGDLITVVGTLKNYNGTIEFDAGCTLEANKKGAGTIEKVEGTMQDIVDQAYALEEGASLAGEATLTGVVSKVNSEWSDQYNNITVTIKVEDREDKPIKCYRLTSGAADASVIKAGDTITVTGIIKNYNGTIEFDAGCVLDKLVAGTDEVPETPKVEGTMQEIVDKAYALEQGATLDGDATLTGTVVEINSAWSTSYNNITVTIEVEDREDKPIMCYRLKSGAADASVIKIGDVITVTGELTNYKGTIEFNSGCVLDKLVAGTGTPETPDEPDEPVVPDTPVTPDVTLEDGDRVVLWSPSEMLAVTATKSSYKYSGSAVTMSEDVLTYGDDACIFVVETTEAGYYKFKLESTGEYLSAYASGTYINLGYNGDYQEWELIELENGTYNIKNATCPESSYGPYFIEYYNGWTVYASSEENAASGSAFQLGIYVVPEEESVQAGDKVVLWSPSEMLAVTATKSSYKYSGSSVTMSEDVLTYGDDACIFVVETTEAGYYKFKLESTGEYLSAYASGTYINLGYNGDYQEWELIELENGTYNIKNATCPESSYGPYFIEYYNGWTVYASSEENAASGSAFQLGIYVVPETEDDETSESSVTLADAIAAVEEHCSGSMNVDGEYQLTRTVTIDDVEFTVTWEIETADANVAKIEDYKLIITASAQADVEYTLTATVTDAAGATETWTKTATVAQVEAENSIQAGDRVVLWSPSEMLAVTATKSSYKYSGSAVTMSEDVLTYGDDACIYVVETTEAGYYKFKLESTGEYLSAYASGTYINLGYNGDYQEWELIELENGTYNIKNATCPESSYGPYFIEYYNGWTLYASSEENAASGSAFQLGIYVVPEEESIQAGDRVVLWSPSEMLAVTATKSSYKYSGSAVTMSEDVLTYGDDACIYVVETTEAGYYKFKLESTGEYLSAYASGTYINLGYNGDYQEWELIELENGTYNIKNATCPESSYGPYFIEYYNGWTLYASSEENAASGSAFQLGIYVVPPVEDTPVYFTKVTTAPTDWSGTYLIVYEDDQKVFDGSLTTLDAVSNYKTFEIADGKIEATDDAKAVAFTIAKSGENYTIKSASGYFIGETRSNKNGMQSNTETEYANTISMSDDGSIDIASSADAHLRFNNGAASTSNDRFRYYRATSYTSQKAIALYKLVED